MLWILTWGIDDLFVWNDSLFREMCNVGNIDEISMLYLQGNGLIWHAETCPDFFFSLQEYTQQNPLKILAANTDGKHF
jgi:hypothetical protein